MKGAPMPTEPPEMSPREYLSIMLGEFNKTFKNDHQLVAAGAAAHHVEVSVGGIEKPFVAGAYNQRVPEATPENVQKIAEAPSVLFECMDYRVSEGLSQDIGADVSIAMAGGAAQPVEARQKTLVDMAVASYKAGKKQIILAGHDGICGGVNHGTNGEAKKRFGEGRTPDEHEFMDGFLTDTARKIEAAGVPHDQIQVWRALVSEPDEHGHQHYTGKEAVDF